MGTSVTGKRPKFYRYYRCNHAERNGHDACPVKSVAAGEIEGAVVEQLRRILRSPDVIARTYRAAQDQEKQKREALGREKKASDKRLGELRKMIRNLVGAGGDGDGALADELRKLNEEYAEVERQLREIETGLESHEQTPITEAEVVDALGKLDPVWDELFPAEQERVVRLLVKEAVLSPDGLDIQIRTNGLRSVVAELRDGGQAAGPADDDTLNIHVPMEFKRRGGRKEIVLPPDAHTTPDVGPRRPIVVALARGRTSGRRCSTRARRGRWRNWPSGTGWIGRMSAECSS